MKVTLLKVTIAKVEADVPALCPKCGADFREGGMLEEHGYIEKTQTCTVNEEGTEIEDYDSFEYAGHLVTGYSCRYCNDVLASTENPPA